MKPIIHVKNSKTDAPILTIDLEHAPGATLTFEIRARMDESKLLGPFEQERWRLLEILGSQINLILRAHEHNY